MTDTKAYSLALETRLKLGLQSIEFLDVYKVASSLGITCIKKRLESNISGATFVTDERVKIILINSAKPVGHQNFTVAHEIYHCLYDKNILNRTCKAEEFNRKRSNEHLADRFAVYLLMPEDGIFRYLGLRHKYKTDTELNLADVVNLEQYFGVSRKAMCWRLEELKLITKSQTSQYEDNVKRSAKLLGKDTALYEPTNDYKLLSDYAEKAREALDKELITTARYNEILADAGLLKDILDLEGDQFAD